MSHPGWFRFRDPEIMVYCTGVIQLPIFGWIKQCKLVVIYSDLTLKVNCLGW